MGTTTVYATDGRVSVMMCDDPADHAQTAARKPRKQKKTPFKSDDILPREYNSGKKEMLRKAGVKFGKVVKGDKLFEYALLPEGWKRARLADGFWTYLIDGQGRSRASIFTNLAPWDYTAFINVHRRYGMRPVLDGQEKLVACVQVTDGGSVVIHETERIPKDESAPWVASEKADALATAWLDKHFPDWKDPAAYWD